MQLGEHVDNFIPTPLTFKPNTLAPRHKFTNSKKHGGESQIPG